MISGFSKLLQRSRRVKVSWAQNPNLILYGRKARKPDTKYVYILREIHAAIAASLASLEPSVARSSFLVEYSLIVLGCPIFYVAHHQDRAMGVPYY